MRRNSAATTSTSARARADGIDFEGFRFNCNGCHVLDPAAGHFGNGGNASFEAGNADREDPATAQRVSEGGHVRHGLPCASSRPGDNGDKGDQVRGFGFLHDGSTDTLFRFFHAVVFNTNGNVGFDADTTGETERTRHGAVRARLRQRPRAHHRPAGHARRAAAAATCRRASTCCSHAHKAPFVSKFLGGNVTECDVVVKGRIGGVARSWLYARQRQFRRGDDGASISDSGPAYAGADARTGAHLHLRAARARACAPDSTATATASKTRWTTAPRRPTTAQTDSDADGVGDVCDNCTLAANASQRDTDGDGYGNACDADFDENGVINFSDLGYMRVEVLHVRPGRRHERRRFVSFLDVGLIKAQFFGAPGPSAVAP